MDLKNISDDTLHAETIRVFGRERTAIAEAVEYLAEVSRRRSYLKYGVPSLYRYGMTHLGLSEFSALQRSRAVFTDRLDPRTGSRDRHLHTSRHSNRCSDRDRDVTRGMCRHRLPPVSNGAEICTGPFAGIRRRR